MSAAFPVVLGKDTGEALWFGSGLIVFKVTSEQSGGAFVLIEDTARRGKTTPLHTHPEHDETLYMVDGEVLLHVDGVEQAAGAGAVASIPRGVPHAFLVTSETARFITFVTPGDARAEAFFREGGEAAQDLAPPPEGTPLDMERIAQAGMRTGFMVMLGLPPFEREARPALKLAR